MKKGLVRRRAQSIELQRVRCSKIPSKSATTSFGSVSATIEESDKYQEQNSFILTHKI
jgi:uncharacterized membrane protein YdbT with pleckstrin-like domain